MIASADSEITQKDNSKYCLKPLFKIEIIHPIYLKKLEMEIRRNSFL